MHVRERERPGKDGQARSPRSGSAGGWAIRDGVFVEGGA